MKLTSVLNAAARVIACLRKFDHVTNTLKELHWLPAEQRIIFKINLVCFKEARNSFFDLGVYLVKSKSRIEDKLRIPWYYNNFSTYDQSLFFHWFPSNSCHHSNGNGQRLILTNIEYLEN